jgi:hypothetical protein
MRTAFPCLDALFTVADATTSAESNKANQSMSRETGTTRSQGIRLREPLPGQPLLYPVFETETSRRTRSVTRAYFALYPLPRQVQP